MKKRITILLSLSMIVAMIAPTMAFATDSSEVGAQNTTYESMNVSGNDANNALANTPVVLSTTGF